MKDNTRTTKRYVAINDDVPFDQLGSISSSSTSLELMERRIKFMKGKGYTHLAEVETTRVYTLIKKI